MPRQPKRPKGRKVSSGSALPPLGKKALAPPEAPNEYAQWEASLTPAEKRIEHLLQLMLAGRWLSGVTDRILAKEWSCTPNYVRSLSAEASRTLRRYTREAPEFRDEQRSRLVALFTAIGHRAMIIGTPKALDTALRAAEVQGRYLGVEPPKQVAIRQPGEFEGLSDAEVRAIAEGASGDGDSSGQ